MSASNDTPVFGAANISNAQAIADHGLSQQGKDSLDGKLNVQFLPLEIIKIDSTNSRKLLIGIEDIKKGPKFPKGDFDEEAQALYKSQLIGFYLKQEEPALKIKQHLNLAIFAASIKKPENLDNPITVVQNGAYMDLIAGERRTLAHHILGAEFIQATIKKFTEYEKAELQYQENAKQEQLSLSEQINAVSKLVLEWEKKNDVKMKRLNAVSVLGVVKTQAGYLLTLSRADDDIQEAINKGVFKNIYDAYEIAKIKNDDKRAEALQAFIDNNPIEIQEEKINKPSALQKKNSNSLLNIGQRKGHKSKSFKTILHAALDAPVFDKIRDIAIAEFQNDDPNTIQNLADYMVDHLKGSDA